TGAAPGASSGAPDRRCPCGRRSYQAPSRFLGRRRRRFTFTQNRAPRFRREGRPREEPRTRESGGHEVQRPVELDQLGAVPPLSPRLGRTLGGESVREAEPQKLVPAL